MRAAILAQAAAVAAGSDRRLRHAAPAAAAGLDRPAPLSRPRRLHLFDADRAARLEGPCPRHAEAERRRSGQRPGRPWCAPLPDRRAGAAGASLGRQDRDAARTGALRLPARGDRPARNGRDRDQMPGPPGSGRHLGHRRAGAGRGARLRRPARHHTGLLLHPGHRRRPRRPAPRAWIEHLDDRRRLVRDVRRRTLRARPPEERQGARPRLRPAALGPAARTTPCT